MDLIIESFRRLYQSGQINEITLLMMVEKGTITENDKEYIMRKDGE